MLFVTPLFGVRETFSTQFHAPLLLVLRLLAKVDLRIYTNAEQLVQTRLVFIVDDSSDLLRAANH
jgi:hypothetical protein